MQIIWGIVVILLTLIAWIGQIITALSPKTAAQLGVCEPEADVDPAFFTDQRAESVWDSFTCWILLAAGILMVFNIKTWPYFGIIGGSIFLNFSGRGIITRLALQKKGIRIGKPETLRTVYLFLCLWLITGIGTTILSISKLLVK